MHLLVGVALVSAAGLSFEITLTRLFAISQGYHFGFLAVSLALLGLGASGSALAAYPSVTQDDDAMTMRRLAHLAFLFALTLVASYLAVNYLPFDSYRVGWEPIQLLYLLLYYLALVAPFFLGGLGLGLPLAVFRAQSARVYAANLLGSGVGCLAALGALALFGVTGAVFGAAMLAAFGALAFARGARQRVATGASLALAAVLGAWLIASPALFDVRISPYKGLSQILRFPDARVVLRAWNAFSQVEVVESGAVRSAPGLSLGYRGAMPSQRAWFIDAESRAPLTDAAPAELLDALPVTLAYRLRPNARALVVEPGGGLEALAALNAGAREIVVVEDNPLIARVARQFAPRVFGDARVRVSTEGPRSWLARSREQFDIVHLALADPFRPVTAGAYALGENYVYTQEAFAEYLRHLDDEGILVVSRWLQLPPTEEARAAALALAALEERGASSVNSEQCVLALRSFNTLLLLVKRTPFTAREIEMARTFAAERQFDWVAYPGLRAEEVNRFNVLREEEYARVFAHLFDRTRRAQFLAAYPYDITPPTDDRPFFFHLFKWEQTPMVLQLLGKLWQPFGGSGYLILLALLGLSLAASAGLILAPLFSRRVVGGPNAPRELLYFGCLGIGFLFVEIPLIQRFILFLDQPVYAFATVLFALLIASGIGSALSERLPHRATLALLVVAILVYPPLLPLLFRLLLGWSLEARIVIALALVAPVGFLLGVPFPKGLAVLDATAPHLVPLAWGVNGCASVISSILATMGALSFGFTLVMVAGAAMYALAMASVICHASAGRTTRP